MTKKALSDLSVDGARPKRRLWKRNLALGIVAAAILSTAYAISANDPSPYALDAITISAAGGVSSSASYSNFLTSGQAVIGKASSESYSTELGFFVETEFPTAIGDDIATLPMAYALRQNYPNPFNPSTTIQFDLPQQSHVTLTIINVQGKRVHTLVSEERAAGVHREVFDASRLASGVYWYHIQAGSFTQSKKLVLLK